MFETACSVFEIVCFLDRLLRKRRAVVESDANSRMTCHMVLYGLLADEALARSLPDRAASRLAGPRGDGAAGDSVAAAIDELDLALGRLRSVVLALPG